MHMVDVRKIPESGITGREFSMITAVSISSVVAHPHIISLLVQFESCN